METLMLFVAAIGATWVVAGQFADVRVEMAELKGATNCTLNKQGDQLKQLGQKKDG